MARFWSHGLVWFIFIKRVNLSFSFFLDEFIYDEQYDAHEQEYNHIRQLISCKSNNDGMETNSSVKSKENGTISFVTSNENGICSFATSNENGH